MLKKVLCLLVLFIGLSVRAQLVQSLGRKVRANKPKPFLKLDTRNSFVGNANILVRGVLVGLEYGGNFRMQAGYNFLPKKYQSKFFTAHQYKMNYLSLGVEYDFYENKKLSASMPVQLGFGVQNKQSSVEQSNNYKGLILYEAMLIGNYQIIKFISAGLGLGYRVVLLGNKAVLSNLNSPIYAIKVNVHLKELVGLIKKS